MFQHAVPAGAGAATQTSPNVCSRLRRRPRSTADGAAVDPASDVSQPALLEDHVARDLHGWSAIPSAASGIGECGERGFLTPPPLSRSTLCAP